MGALVEPGGAAVHGDLDDQQLVQLGIASCSELAHGRGFGPLADLIASLPKAIAPELGEGGARTAKTDVYAVAAAMAFLAGERDLPKPLASLVRQGTSTIPEHRPGPALMGAELARAARRLGLQSTTPAATSTIAPAVPRPSPAPIPEPPPAPIPEPPPAPIPQPSPAPIPEPPPFPIPSASSGPQERVQPPPEPRVEPAPQPVIPPPESKQLPRSSRPAVRGAVALLCIAIALAGAYVGFRAANRSNAEVETAVEGSTAERDLGTAPTIPAVPVDPNAPVATHLGLAVDQVAEAEAPAGHTELKLQVSLSGTFSRAVTLPHGPGARFVLATGALTAPWVPAAGTPGEPIELPALPVLLELPAQPVAAIPPGLRGVQEPFTGIAGDQRTSLPTTMADTVLEGQSEIDPDQGDGDDLVFRVPTGTQVLALVLIDDAGTPLAWVQAKHFGPAAPPDSF